MACAGYRLFLLVVLDSGSSIRRLRMKFGQKPQRANSRFSIALIGMETSRGPTWC